MPIKYFLQSIFLQQQEDGQIDVESNHRKNHPSHGANGKGEPERVDLHLIKNGNNPRIVERTVSRIGTIFRL